MRTKGFVSKVREFLKENGPSPKEEIKEKFGNLINSSLGKVLYQVKDIHYLGSPRTGVYYYEGQEEEAKKVLEALREKRKEEFKKKWLEPKPKTGKKIMEIFRENPDSQFSVKEIWEMVGGFYETVRTNLRNYELKGKLKGKFVGREKVYELVKIKILSKEEINKDLKRNLVGLKKDFNNLFKEANNLIFLKEKEIRENYSCGYYLREFIDIEFRKRDGRVSYAAKEILPVVFTPMLSVKQLYNIVSQQKGAHGLTELKEMEIINVGMYNGIRTSIAINDFETIREGIIKYLGKQKRIRRKNIAEKFNEKLKSLKENINMLSEFSTSIYNNFDSWWWKEKRKGYPPKLFEDFVKNTTHEIISYEILLKQIS